jgi:hypothetical protein
LGVADDPLVAGGLAGHQPLAQAGHGGDDDLVAVAGERVGGEGDPGRGGWDHDLDQDRHLGPGPRAVGWGGLGMGLAVDGDTGRGGRVDYPPHRVGQLVQADVQDGLVQAGKRRADKILGAG